MDFSFCNFIFIDPFPNKLAPKKGLKGPPCPLSKMWWMKHCTCLCIQLSTKDFDVGKGMRREHTCTLDVFLHWELILRELVSGIIDLLANGWVQLLLTFTPLSNSLHIDFIRESLRVSPSITMTFLASMISQRLLSLRSVTSPSGEASKVSLFC